MAESVFASKAKVGERYSTKSGCTVKVVQVDIMKWSKPGIIVQDEATGSRISLDHGTLLWPVGSINPSEENRIMAKIIKGTKKENAEKSLSRGARKENGAVVIFREWKGKVHEATLKGDKLHYGGKDFGSIIAVVEAIKGKAARGTGRTFFGLRRPENVTLGKEILGALKDEKPEPKKAEKPAKAKRTKPVDEDEDEERAPRTVADVVAKVMGKGRK